MLMSVGKLFIIAVAMLSVPTGMDHLSAAVMKVGRLNSRWVLIFILFVFVGRLRW